MYIELNEAQLRYAEDNATVLNYIERGLNEDGSLRMQSGYENAEISNRDIQDFTGKKSIFYVHENDYCVLPAEMRALSSPTPHSVTQSLDSKTISTEIIPGLAVFDEHDQEHYFSNEPDDTTLILNHIVVDANGGEISKNVEIQRDSFETAKMLGFKILIEKEMKTKPSPSTPSQEPKPEPDYKALALLLIDLYEEKQDVDSKIAAIKSQLQ